MLLSALSVLVVAQSSSEIPEGLVNNPVYIHILYKIFHYDRSLFRAVLCKLFVVTSFMFHFSLLVESFFFLGAPFPWCIKSVIKLLIRSIFSFFLRGSLDETVLRSVNFGAYMVRILSMSCFVHSTVVYTECRHIQFFVQSRGIFSLALIGFL